MAPRRIGALLLGAALLSAPVAARPQLLWSIGGESAAPADERRGGESFNPASVVKLATTWWALERLGPEHRFTTRFLVRGHVDAPSGTLHGDVRVVGGADPDFHVENAQLVARHLEELGIRHVDGALVMGPEFWIGWEGGAERTEPDPDARRRIMADRLARAWDPRRWDRRRIRGMKRFHERASLDGRFSRVTVARTELASSGEPDDDWTEIAVHHSKPLVDVLQRFNIYSNNDIERLGTLLGTPEDLTGFLGERWPDDPVATRFETLSGLGVNRMTPRQIVRVLDGLSATLERHDMQADRLLPVLHCGRSTLGGFPNLEAGLPAAAVVAKTGTLVQTDGGVVALAGWLRDEGGQRSFVVARTGNGALLHDGRRALGRWVLERAGPADAGECPDPAPYPEQGARLNLRPLEPSAPPAESGDVAARPTSIDP